MRLKTIKLSGFKSFVDPTSIPIHGRLIGVVGPNGCGKSNIIDAVRWVMGESSAKHLRGDSMADVVFNGSNSRKPVGQAAVEIIFDNSDGAAGGQYASYAEISIRREAGRDGQSDYFLNRTRCRRKDITDLFLGTGLGPRTYSIIEQGMVTRIIEAKPEDLRGFIEEAAGISRYRERRRETENRIKHTRENLERVEDIRNELGAQLARLEKQSKAAARYKELKQEERLTRAQLLALRFRDLDGRVQEHDRHLAENQNALDAVLAEQRAIEAEIERLRAHQVEAGERHNTVHAEFYAVGAEITRLEQAIEHARETRAHQGREQDQLNRSWEESSALLHNDQTQLDELNRALAALAPKLAELTARRDAAAAARARAEQAMQQWQNEWERYSTASAEQAKTREIQLARLVQLERQIADLDSRKTRLGAELSTIETELSQAPAATLRREAAELDQDCETRERELASLEDRLRALRQTREQTLAQLDTLRPQLHNAEARLTSLRELQTGEQARHDAPFAEWLHGRGLDRAPRLAGRLTVEAGWEKAVERVLGSDLVAVCVREFDAVATEAAKLKPVQLTLVDLGVTAVRRGASAHPALLDKLTTELDLTPRLAGIYVADTLAAALKQRDRLTAQESIITRDGTWVGRNWISFVNETGERSGWLAREREIENLQKQLAGMQTQSGRLQTELTQAQQQLNEFELQREETGRQLNESHRARAERREQLGHKEARFTQLEARRDQIRRESEELEAQWNRDRAAMNEATGLLRGAETAGNDHEQERVRLIDSRPSLQAALDAARTQELTERDARHSLEIERQGLQTQLESIRASLARLAGQQSQLSARRAELAQLLSVDNPPELGFTQKLDEFLAQRVEVERRLAAARQAVTDVEAALRAQEDARHRKEKQVQELRERLEAMRVTRQEILVRRDTLAEQVREAGFDLAAVLRELPEAAGDEAWQQKLEQLAARVERLGPINLVAIEEYTEQSERKGYLDKQSEDLLQALTMLSEAIRKMDRETRTLFKQTFDQVNEHFQNFFPQLFGGGSAHLELTDNDLLESGVGVMARPPGKRNSTIHLLSGGEKALTAVALIFSIFQLNPAPFCLLDEVDAPLDDANVERYCETLKVIAERTQLIYVTHNKISMEMADILVGVTMSEPGVSRLVAVDVEEALEMVAQ